MIRNNKGFSLVELMVVVAIIGILSAIAIPQINKYMARARQTEAKTNLASIYTASKAFYAEYNVYDPRLLVIGFRPEGRLRYNTGFESATECSPTLNDFGYTAPIADNSQNSLALCGTGGAIIAPKTCIVLPDGNQAIIGSAITCPASGNATFTAGAIGRISSSSAAANLDRWTVDQNKDLKNTNDGTQ